MRPVFESDLRDQAARLLAELKAIEHWNTAYWQTCDPHVHETIAFLTRNERRSEIIGQMLLMRRFFLDVPAEGRVCPYCEGKGCVLVEMVTAEGPVRITRWVSQDCPLCLGTGRLYGSTEPIDI